MRSTSGLRISCYLSLGAEALILVAEVLAVQALANIQL